MPDDYSELLSQPLMIWSAVIVIAFLIFLRLKHKLQTQQFETARILVIIMPIIIFAWLIYGLVHAIIG